MRGESTPPTVLDEFTLEQQAQKEAAVAGEPNRAWRNRVKKQIRAQIKATESQKALAALKPDARTLFARRHAVLAVSEDQSLVTFLRACTCEIGRPHTESGTGVTLEVTA